MGWLRQRQNSSAQARRRKKDGLPRRRRQATAWDGQEFVNVTVLGSRLNPVENLCFETNYRRTAEFLANWQRRVQHGATKFRGKKSWLVRSNNPGQRYIGSYYDFAKIQNISTAASVLIAAEYERGRIIVGAPPPAINYTEWSDAAFFKLHQMGFFKSVGLATHDEPSITDEDGAVTMKIVSGTVGDALDASANALEELLREQFPDSYLEPILFSINTAVSEGLTNIANWAYRENTELSLKRWWFAATVAPAKRLLTFVVYDQGVTIPGSLPHQRWYEDFITFVCKLSGRPGRNVTSISDSHWITAAIEYGRSRSRMDHRGKGLAQIAQLIDQCDDGSLRIVSRRGSCYLAKGQPIIEERPTRNGLAGTLLEWHLRLPVLKNGGHLSGND